jgi:hypothetical protein
MDKIVAKLNEKLAEQVAKKKPENTLTEQPGGQSKFSQMLQEKISQSTPVTDSLQNQITTAQKGQSEELFAKMNEELKSEEQQELKVVSADDIRINISDSELGTQTRLDPKEKFLGIFEDLNSDMLSLDSAIEVLADPGTKLTKRQLLAYQAGIGNMTINTELFSRLAQSVAQNLNTLLNTNVG